MYYINQSGSFYYGNKLDDLDTLASDEQIAEYQVLLNEAKAYVLTKTYEFIQELSDQLSGKVPECEKLGWTLKYIEAQDYLNYRRNLEDLPLLSSEAKIRNISPEELCQRIITKAKLYHLFSGYVTGFRLKTEEFLDSCKIVEDVYIGANMLKQQSLENFQELLYV